MLGIIKMALSKFQVWVSDSKPLRHYSPFNRLIVHQSLSQDMTGYATPTAPLRFQEIFDRFKKDVISTSGVSFFSHFAENA